MLFEIVDVLREVGEKLSTILKKPYECMSRGEFFRGW